MQFKLADIDNFQIKNYVKEGTDIVIDFEDSTDTNYFAVNGGTKWTVSDGAFNDQAWGRMYYKSPILTTDVRIISFDMYIKDGILPSFGLVNASYISKALDTQKSGVFWHIKSNTNTWISSCLTGAHMNSVSADFSKYYDGVHKMEI